MKYTIHFIARLHLILRVSYDAMPAVAVNGCPHMAAVKVNGLTTIPEIVMNPY